MDSVSYHTRYVAASERAAHWANINRDHFGELEVDGMDGGIKEAALSLFRVGDLQVFRIDVPAHRVRRSRRRCNDRLDDCYKLILQKSGNGRIRLRSSQFDLRPSDWSLYDPRVPFSIEVLQNSELLAITVPRERLNGFAGMELHTCESPTSGGVGLAAILGSFLTSMSEKLSTLPDDSTAAVSETVIGLLSATLARRRAVGQEYATLPEVLSARVRQYVQAHWADPSLDITQIAAAMRCSTRHLHRAFSDGDRTLERYIWRTRLDNARRLLQSKGSDTQVGVLAAACGFRTAAHFCRMFKSEFGLSPGALKRNPTLLGPGV